MRGLRAVVWSALAASAFAGCSSATNEAAKSADDGPCADHASAHVQNASVPVVADGGPVELLGLSCPDGTSFVAGGCGVDAWAEVVESDALGQGWSCSVRERVHENEALPGRACVWIECQ